MPEAYPIELRERAVGAYEDGEGSYEEVAWRFGIGMRTLVRWVDRSRETGCLEPRPKRGGNKSPVDIGLLHRVVEEQPDSTVEELRRAYNRRAPRKARVHRSSIVRALRRAGYVFKKNAHVLPNRTDQTSKRSGKRSSAGRSR